ncbi:hypothetical protein L6452_02516 [Arctium lappa]|uniref:Uncharacterized protein n=1 Tax=Arctium lappa TaxID=4217 RepID=A0ACB9FJ20_ARCLA|nr:hypothetical protein L6452_02516 [Arctium lappa]
MCEFHTSRTQRYAKSTPRLFQKSYSMRVLAKLMRKIQILRVLRGIKDGGDDDGKCGVATGLSEGGAIAMRLSEVGGVAVRLSEVGGGRCD